MVQLSKEFDVYSSKYENFIALGDFIVEMTNIHMEEFCSVYNFKNFIKDPACFKNPEKPTTTDHILTKHRRCFQHSGAYEKGLCDFLRQTLTFRKYAISNRILKSYNTETTRTVLTNILGETFYGSYLFKTFNLMNLINSNLLLKNS